MSVCFLLSCCCRICCHALFFSSRSFPPTISTPFHFISSYDNHAFPFGRLDHPLLLGQLYQVVYLGVAYLCSLRAFTKSTPYYRRVLYPFILCCVCHMPMVCTGSGYVQGYVLSDNPLHTGTLTFSLSWLLVAVCSCANDCKFGRCWPYTIAKENGRFRRQDGGSRSRRNVGSV